MADGAVGIQLSRLHPERPYLEQRGPPEAMNLSQPETVRGVHLSFREAGAVVHRTNTRFANSVALSPHGLADRCEAINNSGSALLREAVGHEAPMMGAVGQILPDADGTLAGPAERERAYSEQVVYLADTGVTFITLEHFSSVEEATRLLRIARSACDAPVLAQLSLDGGGCTAEGIHCGEAARRLVDNGAEALGVSCGPAPELLRPIVETLLSLEVPVSVMLGVQAKGWRPPLGPDL